MSLDTTTAVARSATAVPTDEFLTTEEVATWLKVAPSTVCRWRLAGKGPRVVWLSPSLPRYRRDDVVVWLDQAAA
jgi:predicted DNA-binding transcriptional regulator AlpA